MNGPPAEKEREFVCGDWTAEVEALRGIAAIRAKEADLFFGLGSLGARGTHCHRPWAARPRPATALTACLGPPP